MEQRLAVLVAAIVEHDVCACVCSRVKCVRIPIPRVNLADSSCCAVIHEAKHLMKNRVKWLIQHIERERRQIREFEFEIDEAFAREKNRIREFELEIDEAFAREKNRCKRQRVIQDETKAAVAAPSTLPEQFTKSNDGDKASLLYDSDGLFGEERIHARGECVGEERAREGVGEERTREGVGEERAREGACLCLWQVCSASVENELRMAVEEQLMETRTNESVTAVADMLDE